MVDEKAVEAGQLSQPAQSEGSLANVGYFQPHQLDQLEKYGRLYLIADGLGGAASQIASQYTIKKLLHSFYNAEPPTDPQERLLEVIQQANQEIFERNTQQPERRGMVTMLTAALIHQNKLVVARVGDGQVYVVWDQDIERLTQEIGSEASNSSSEKAAEAVPKLLPAKIEPPPNHPVQAPVQISPKQRLAQGLGLDKTVKIDLFARRLFAGDVVILSSGGLSGYVAEKEIARAVTRHPPDQAMKRVMALARERGSYEHLALSLTRILSTSVVVHPPDPMPLPDAPKWSDWAAAPKPLNQTEAAQPTQPNSPAATQPMKPIETKEPRSFTEGLPTINWRGRPRRPQWRWYTFAIITLILVTLCALPVLAWSYINPPRLIASVFLDETPERISVPAEAAAETTPETETSPVPTETATMAVSPSPVITSPASAGDTLVAESSSPVATPASRFVSPVSTPTAVISSAVVARVSTPVPTPGPTIQVPVGCESKARFNGDITIPDGTEFTPGETFEKIWRVQNAGTCPWGSGYTVRFIGGESMGSDGEEILTQVVEPNTNGEIRVPLIAPETPGTYRGDWQLFDLQGEPFGPEMYLEIEVVPLGPTQVDEASVTVLYDFIENAENATWTSQTQSYVVLSTEISETLELTAPQGLVATGIAQLRGNSTSDKEVLLTYPHQEIGFIQGAYQIETPLQPTDSLMATLGFTKLSILSDDGVTFEIGFTPPGGQERLLLSREVQYQDSPVSEVVPLDNIEPGQTGIFTLRVRGGESLSQDWALWLDLRLVRP